MSTRSPWVGGAPGWPLVLYFHHVHPRVDHYTALTEDAFRRALDTVLTHFGPALDPALVGPRIVPPDTPTVLFTFDDGYRDNLTRAVPLLTEFGVGAVLFCVTDRIDEASSLTDGVRARLAPRRTYLDWAETDRMAGLGHTVGAHTRTHPHLTELTRAQAEQEVAGSFDRITAVLGRYPRSFAYPYGEVAHSSVLPDSVLGFGTVKSPARPWDSAPHEIRRTYLPTDLPETWVSLAEDWKRQWYG